MMRRENACVGAIALALSGLCCSFLLVSDLSAEPTGQRTEIDNGVRVVHNEKGGVWGTGPTISLELVRKIGDIDTEDEHVAFNYPSDVAVDREGNIYILDSANARIQKFGPNGKYQATIGRKGQGPGEFMMPDSMTFDKVGNLVVADSSQARIHIIMGGGKDVRSVVVKEELVRKARPLASGDFLAQGSTYAFPRPNQPTKNPDEMRLFHRIAADGRTVSSFGSLTDFGEMMTTAVGNGTTFDVGGGDSLYVSYTVQNRVERYGPDGTLLWRADRPLNYSTEVKKKGKIETSGGQMVSTSGPEMNACSVGIAVDGHGRAWVVTYSRQLKKEEKVQTTMMTVGGRGGVSNVSVKTEGNTDLRTTDAFKLEVFDPSGVLLGALPLTHFVDVIRVFGDQLFLIDRERGVTVYQYRIVDN